MSDTTGIDLSDAETYGLITRIFWSRSAPQAKAGGLDPDDLWQDFCIRLMRSNPGGSPFDSKKSSLSNYIYLSATSLLRNQVDSKRRAERRDWVTGEEDVALSYSASVEAEVEDTEVWHSGVCSGPSRPVSRQPWQPSRASRTRWRPFSWLRLSGLPGGHLGAGRGPAGPAGPAGGGAR